jgi:ribosomal protein S6
MSETSQESKDSFTQANEAQIRPVYEVAFHLVPTLGDEGVPGAVEKIRAAIGSGAEFISESFPAKITFAYIIERASAGKRDKFSEGYFGWIKFGADRENIPALETALRSDKNVLRHLLIETVREDISAPRRAVYASDRLEGETIKKPVAAKEETKEVSQEELDKSIDAIVN